ncbi:MAG: hypothetical protein U1F28_05235 [Acinetobacter sp.]
MDHWPALKNWSPAYFQQVVGNQEIEVQFNREQDPLLKETPSGHKTKMTMRDYVDLVTQTDHSNNFYMTANNAKASQSSLTKLFRDIGHFHAYTDQTQLTDRSFYLVWPQGCIYSPAP